MEQNRQNVSPMNNEARNTYVILQITKSLITLLQKKSLADISISELCQAAGVGRTSFYRNFQTKEDILEKKIRALLVETFSACDAEGSHSDAHMWGELFHMLEDHAAFFLLLQKRQVIYLLLNALTDILNISKARSNQEAYGLAFVANGIYGWIVEWLRRGMTESADEIVRALMEGGMK